jgi:membrane-associated HD superfamily phosphohydrolase
MKTVFIVISSILLIVNVLPYLRDVYRRKTKPRVVSWLNWSLLTVIACAASFSDHQYASAILALIASLETLSVVILGLKYGDRHITPFDIACQIGAVIGLILWLIFNSPSVAIIASLTIDFIVGLPTLKHAWGKPHEETAITFFMSSLAAVFTLLAVSSNKITAIALPIYLILANLLIFVIIVGRERAMKALALK